MFMVNLSRLLIYKFSYDREANDEKNYSYDGGDKCVFHNLFVFDTAKIRVDGETSK